MEADEKECPFCAEIIKAKAKKCKHFSAMLALSQESNEKNIVSLPNTRKEWISEKYWLDWEAPLNLIRGEQMNTNAIVSLIPQTLLSRRSMLWVAAEVLLQREPDNRVDSNAIKAIIKQKKVGYLAKELAAVIAPLMDTNNLKSMKMAGLISGIDIYGISIWPNRGLSDFIPIEASIRDYKPSKMPNKDEMSGLTAIASKKNRLPASPRPLPEYHAAVSAQIKAEKARDNNGCMLICGISCLAIAAPYVYKYGSMTVIGINLTLIGSILTIPSALYFFDHAMRKKYAKPQTADAIVGGVIIVLFAALFAALCAWLYYL